MPVAKLITRLCLFAAFLCAALVVLAVGVGGIVPSSHMIAFASYLIGDAGTSYDVGESDIYLSEIDRNILFDLTRGWKGWQRQPIWSPDSERLAFLSYPVPQHLEVYVVDWDGNNPQKIADFEGQVANVLWSPDSKQIAISLNGWIRILDVDATASCLSFEQGECSYRNIVSDEIVGGMWDWSPDTNQILFSNSADIGEIFSITPNGSNTHQLTNNDYQEIYPRWSPDSKQITFLSLEEAGWQIYLMDQDGSYLRPIGEPISIPNTFEWSLDGQSILFSTRGLQNDIYVLSVDDGTVDQITNNGAFPIELPNAQQFAFVTENNSGRELVVTSYDGNEIYHAVANLPPLSAWVSLPTWRPQP